MLIPPVAVRFTAPFAKISPAAAIISVPPVAFSVTMPAPVVVIALFTVIMLAAMFTPAAVFVFTPVPAAPIVVVPLPVVCTSDPAVKLLFTFTFPALLISTRPSRTGTPTVLLKVMSPAPALSVRFSAPAVVPFSVLLKTMLLPSGLPPALVVSIANAPPFNVTPVANVTASAVVVTVRLPVTVTVPAPFCVTAPSLVMLPLIVSSPAFVKVTTPALVVVIVLFTVRALPVMNRSFGVFSAPLTVMLPVVLWSRATGPVKVPVVKSRPAATTVIPPAPVAEPMVKVPLAVMVRSSVLLSLRKPAASAATPAPISMAVVLADGRSVTLPVRALIVPPTVRFMLSAVKVTPPAPVTAVLLVSSLLAPLSVTVTVLAPAFTACASVTAPVFSVRLIGVPVEFSPLIVSTVVTFSAAALVLRTVMPPPVVKAARFVTAVVTLTAPLATSASEVPVKGPAPLMPAPLVSRVVACKGVIGAVIEIAPLVAFPTRSAPVVATVPSSTLDNSSGAFVSTKLPRSIALPAVFCCKVTIPAPP